MAGGSPEIFYAGLVKRAALGADGILRAMWWEANHALKSNTLAIQRNGTSLSVTDCSGDCMTSGLWLEGTGSGVWLEMVGSAGVGGFGFAFDAGSGNFTIGASLTPRAGMSKVAWEYNRGKIARPGEAV